MHPNVDGNAAETNTVLLTPSLPSPDVHVDLSDGGTTVDPFDVHAGQQVELHVSGAAPSSEVHLLFQ